MDECQQRLERARKACNTFPTDYRKIWTLDPIPDIIGPIVKGKNIIEIGYGRDGGLAEYFQNLGAGEYRGVDIDEEAFRQSLRHASGNRIYLLDDPVHVLKSCNPAQESIIVSSAVLEDLIIKEGAYLRDLITAIVKQVKKGFPTIHLSRYIEMMDPFFLDEGLVVQKNTPEFLRVYGEEWPTSSSLPR